MPLELHFQQPAKEAGVLSFWPTRLVGRGVGPQRWARGLGRRRGQREIFAFALIKAQVKLIAQVKLNPPKWSTLANSGSVLIRRAGTTMSARRRPRGAPWKLSWTLSICLMSMLSE